MNKFRKLAFAALAFFTISLLFADQSYSYVCPSGTTCSDDGGGVPYWYSWTWNGQTYCTKALARWSCSGTNSSCSGESPSVNGKYDSQNCNTKYGDSHWYCCNGSCDNTCDGSCDVPNCPSNTQETKNGCDVQSTPSCKYQNDCGEDCSGGSRTCYYKEPTDVIFVQSNGSTNGPASVSITVDGKLYTLSTDPNNPTHIKLPALGSSNVQVSTPTFIAPATSTGAKYLFQANNYGVNDEWKTWVSCDSAEDFCTTTPSSNNTQAFVPTSMTVNQVLKENAAGKISAQYAHSKEHCDNSYVYSPMVEGYYVVDTDPVLPPIITPDDIFPDITTDVTSRGCSSLTYTGLEINNPLHVVVSATDANNNDEISALTLWFSKDDTVPTTGTITGTYSGSSNQDLGIMIKKNGTNWSNPYIYATNTSPFAFAQLNGEYITVNGSNVARIYDVSVTQGTSVTFDYKIEFLASTEALSGMYNVYGGALDSYMINVINNVTYIDQSYFKSLTDWGIDLVNPVVNDITQQVRDATSTYLTWSVADTISGVGRTVMNAYRVGGLVTDNATLYLPATYTTSKGSITLEALPTEENIGAYAGTNAWVFTSSAGEKDLLNIGNSEEGNIDIYATTYDNACNNSAQSEVVDLGAWIATRGGILYSSGNITSSPKDVSSVTALDGVFSTKTQMTKDKIDLGTELLATTSVNISDLVHPTLGAIRSLSTYDSNNSKGYWFDRLIAEFQKYRSHSTEFTQITTSISADCTGDSSCYFLPITTGDITIPSGYVCDQPALIVSNNDIYIEPDIESGSGLSGCIFLAKNNIYIGAGNYLSTGSKVLYDFIEGAFIAENKIIITAVDKAKSVRDGLEVFGSLIAFGSQISDGRSAITVGRSMRLFNQTNPALAITYDNRYTPISTLYFGQQAIVQRQEIGFKSY